VANPHNYIDDVALVAGTPAVVDGVVDVHLRYYDRKLDATVVIVGPWASSVLWVLFMTCDACVTCYCIKSFMLCI
jgi:hypothetical protein